MSLWSLPAHEIAARVAGRQVSAREVARDALERLEAVNPAIHAVVECRPDEVLAQADAIDAALARGAAPGLLCGVPVTTKINTDQRGHATTNGLKANRDLVAEHDSPVVENLRRAGAVILGRTNAPTLSARWFTDNLLHGRTRNPRDPALTPGGSSGGAGAAVAAGVGAIAQGTDIAGSIRYPAYACGVHGLRPSLGRVPSFNATGPERTIGAQLTAVSGPLARTIADLRLALAAMAAPSPRDPWHVPAPLDGPAVARRAIVCVAPDGLATTPEVAEAVRDAGRRLAAAGWSVEEVGDLPPLAEAAELGTRLWFGEAYAAMRPAAEADGDP
ncbi:MAG: amidase, partial [Caulobacteraceae bacterium]|nr:amidase [Caulobacter sp.]